MRPFAVLPLLVVVLSSLFAGAPARAQSLTVTGTTILPEDTVASYASITVQNGGTLEIGGGSDLTVSGALAVEAGGTVVCRSKNITAQIDGAWIGTGVTIRAGSVSVAASARISADGQGYANGFGPGFPTGLSANIAYRTGASHGGTGTGAGFMPTYGDALAPTTPGQGAAFYDNETTAGGGAIRLIVDGTLTLHGEISADGTGTPPASNVFHGGATGGSIWVTAGTLTGSGSFSADARAAAYNAGVTSYGQSSGGRIAIHAGSADGFTGWTASTVNAGGGTAQTGSFVVAIGAPGAAAMRIVTRAEFPVDTQLTLQSLTLEPATTLSLGGGSDLQIAGALVLGDGASMLCGGTRLGAQVDGVWAGEGVSIRAGSAIIPATAKISADGQGYRNAVGPGMSPTLAPTSVEARRAGASHGGQGTGGGTNQPVMPVYGSSLEPTTPGQGAGGAATDFVAGGGAIRLIVDGTLTLDGTITSNGVSTGSSRGGATGGSLWITAGTLAGSGRFAADAIEGTGTYRGDSGGGRIAVYYGTDAGFGGFLTSSVNPSTTAGQPGTLVFINTSPAGGGAVRVSQRMTLDDGPVFSAGSLTVDNGATLSVGPRVALDIEGTLTVTGNATIQLASADVLAAVDGAWVGTGARVEAGHVLVAAGSRISADGEGYRNGIGPGMSPTLVPTSVEARRAGASHGGQGTGGGTDQPVMPAYGSSLEPTTPGQGAGGAATDVVAGGGAIRLIVAGTLTLDGTITSNGIGLGNSRGGATGGSIWVTTGTLAGSGRFAADAIEGTGTYRGESAGGRIAVYYGADAGFGGFLTSTVNAGTTAGQPGTLVFIKTSAEGLSMRVNQRMTLDEGPIFSLRALSIENGSTVEVAGGVALDIEDSLTLTGNSTLQLRSENHLAQVDGGWLGTGATIVAGNVTVTAGSRISVDGEGYRNGNGPGFPVGLPVATDENTGASYGGRGLGPGALLPFGDPLVPVSLGTGAAIGDNETTAGGGALRLIVHGTLALDGEISADGIATTPGFQVSHGGATGGSLWVTTNTLTGSGRFTAEGYPGVFINGFRQNNSSSGGRAAIYYRSAGGFTGFADSTAGAPNSNADPGTMLFIQDDGGQLSVRAFERVDVLPDRILDVHALTLETGARLDLYGGATLRVADMLDVKDDVLVNFWSRNRDSSFADAWIGEGARIDAGDMRIAPTAILTADAQGYRDGMGPGGPNTGDGSNGTGGSYGGKGSGAAAKPPYGSLVAPRDLGSAGGYNRNAAHPNTSTTAGGAIFLNVVRSLELNGLITATGTFRDTTNHAGATGGSILIRADRLSGSGSLNADAVVGSGNNQSSGGRIAIWATTNTLPAGAASARAGGPTAQPGTIHYADGNAIAWIRSPLEVFTGPTRLDWLATGSATTTGIDISAQPAAGPVLTLATGLAPTASLLWDTTTLEDGLYTLTATKRDTRTGAILGTDTRTVTLLNNALVLRGTITQSVTIPAGKVSFIVGPIVIPAGVTVTAEPGAIIKVSLGASVLVEAGGTLSALGTSEAPILFTSLLDDTAGGDSNFDGSATAPGVVDWNGLRSNGGTITFNEHAEVRHAVEMVDNDITTTVRWRAGSVRVITRQIDIIQGGALTIEPGAIVKFARNTGIRVIAGTLSVEGTLLRPVIFTSEKDDSVGGDSNGDGSLTTPIPGDYYGIQFEDTVSTLRHAEFRYGAESWAGFRGLLDINTADVTVQSCTFVDILFEAAYLQPDHGGTATFENCIFTRVDRPIFANRGSVAVVRNCVFDGNRRAIHISGGRVDVYNSAITNSLNWGVIVDDGSAITDFVNNAFWNPRATGGNVTGATIAIGANGVIEGDPRFVDRGALDYRVLAGSALIDAGSAAQDVPADFRGFARLGAAPEIGAFEFTASHPSPVDLTARISDPPSSALSGSAVDLTVVVRNAGTAPVTAPWRHAIFLRPMDGGADVPVAEFVDQPATSLASGASATFTTRVDVPEGLVGLYTFGITVNPREEVFEGIHSANNTSVAETPTAMDVPELPFGGSVIGRFFRAGESRVFKVRPATPGQTIHVLGDTEATRGFTRLLAARGRVPTEDNFDTQSPQWDQPDATLAIANSADDWYYVRIVASELRVPTTAFTLSARAVQFQLSGLGVTTVGTGPVTVGVLGTDLRQGATVSLRPVSGASGISARDVVVTGGTSADASFDLTGAAPGLYDVVVTQGGLERVLPGSLRVSSAATGANIITTVAGPGVNRVGFPYFAAVTARNTGAADSPAPIITVSGPGMPVDLNDPESPFFGYGYAGDDTGRDFFLAIPPTGNPAFLPAGRSAEVFIAQGITPDGRFEVATNIIQVGDTTPYDLVGFGATLAPNPKPAGWDDAWTLLATSEPQTLGGLAHLTATAADALYRQSGYRSNDVAEILARHVDAVRIAMLNRIHGRVRWLDASVQAPLGGILVSLVDFDGMPTGTSRTLADGSFSFPAIPSGVYDWEFEGAFPAAAFAPLEVTFGTTIEGIELTVVSGASAHARVLPVAGVPFEAMLVTLHNLELGVNASAVPDALGQVTLRGLPEATFTLTALAPGRTTVTRPGVNVVLGASNDLGQIQFSSTAGSLTGTVVRQDMQAPIAGAAVFVADVPGAFARTDETGAYRIETVPTGVQTLRVVAPGFATVQAGDVAIVGGAETTRDISLAPGASVSGVVTVGGGAGEGGTAVAGATVELTDGTQVLMSAQSDATGRYTLSDLPAGSFTLQAFNDLRGAASAPVVVALATQTVANLELVPTKTISGAVRYSGGTLAGQIGMRVQGVAGTPEFTVTNSDGRFVLNGLPAGDYVWALADGGRRTPLTVAADGTTTTSLSIALDAGEIVGRVFAADGTTPLATMVQLVREGKVISSTASNAAGDYRFALVAPGTYEVHAIGLEQYFTPVKGVVVAAGSGATAPALIGGFATLDLSVRLASSGAPPSGFALAFLDPVGGPHGTTTQLLERIDASGAARFTSLAPGAYRVHAIGVGVASGQTIIEVAVGANRASLTLDPCGYVGGRITGPGGVGVEGLDVIVHRAGDIARQWTGQTNRDGDYAIGGLLPGDYVLQVADRRTSADTAPLLIPAGQALTIAAGDDLVRNLALVASAQTISGRMAATDGSFPFRADIAVRNAAGIEVLRRRLDGTGAFALPLPAAGEYTLTASALGFLAPDQAITVGTTAITADLAATWTGGAAQLSLGSSAFATHDGPPLQALSVSSLFGWVGECKDAFRELLEDVLQKPEPPQPDFFAPDFLKDPCLSCPAAKAAWDRTARLQMIANNQYSAWHDAWQAQVEQISAEVGLLGVNLLKLAGAMAQAELEMLDIAKTVAEEIPKMGALLASIAKSSTQEPYLEWAIERHDELWKLQDGLNAIFYTGIAGGVAGQLDPSNGKGPKFMESLSNLFKPSTYQSWDSIYGICADITGVIKAITDLGQLSGKFRTAFEGTPLEKVLKALDKFFTLMDPLVQSFKTVQTALNTSMAVQNSKDLYYRAINARNEAYAECMSAMEDCECVGGEECGCEDPPPPPPKPPKPPKPPGGPDGGNGSGRGDRAHDPNAKYTIGYGDAGYVRPDEPLIYTITFENIADAGLPAQRVVITDQLSDLLDWSTFELLAAGFNRTSFAIPPGLQRYTTRANVATDPNPVKCDFRLNPATGLFTIDLRSVDAVTGGFPRDSLAGFLPPNDAQHRGEGFVTFMIKPKPGQADGTQIRNIASIVFDTNEAIITNESLNTLDATPPQGRVTTLARRSGNSFEVSWSGLDLGSGAVAYDVWVSRNNGPWELWQRDVSATSATFVGEPGNNYRFFATARDGVGWSDAPRFAPDTSTIVGTGSRLANISTRGVNGTGSDAMIVGFYIAAGSGTQATKNLLIRGVGPGLDRFDVPGTLADPRLDLFDLDGLVLVGNDNWSSSPDAGLLASESSRLHAFSLAQGSADAAMLVALAADGYTARVSGAAGAQGVALVEAYDADPSLLDDTAPRLINLSTRGRVGTGSEVLIAGFVIVGDTPKSLLIRAVGPTLANAPFDVPGVLADPHVRLVDRDGVTVFENNNWSNSPDPALISEVSEREGAFSLPAQSKDAVMLVVLEPGSYTTIVSGMDGGTGVALVELYDIDP